MTFLFWIFTQTDMEHDGANAGTKLLIVNHVLENLSAAQVARVHLVYLGL